MGWGAEGVLVEQNKRIIELLEAILEALESETTIVFEEEPD